MTLVIEQLLNGLQLGVMLFLLAAGLTLIFGVMGVINLAHGSLYMVGAYGAALAAAKTGSPALALVAGVAAAAVAGMAVELAVMRRLYARDHLDQVLATFALIMIFNQATTALFGRQPLFVAPPPMLSGSVVIPPGFAYPVFRLATIAVGLAVASACSCARAPRTGRWCARSASTSASSSPLSSASAHCSRALRA